MQSQEPSKKTAIVRMLIPLVLTVVALAYAWVKLLYGHYIPQWQHYLGLVAFLIVLALYMNNRATGTMALGVYLILGITTIFGLTYDVSSAGFGIGPLKIPVGNLWAWGIFIIYWSLNMGNLFEYYLDFQQRKRRL